MGNRVSSHNHYIFILLLLIFSLLLRIWHIGSVPTALFCDEASIGYNAYSIINTGKDEYGKQLPIFFKSFGEYKNPVQTYSTTLFVKIFGLNEFSVRITSIIYGLLSIIAIFLFTRELIGLFFKKHIHEKNIIAFFSALFLAISPWHIFLSRVSLEGLMPYVFFTTIASYFFIKTLKNEKYMIMSGLFFCLAIYSYFSARIFIPLFGLCLGIIFFRVLAKKFTNLFFSILLVFILLLPIITNLKSPEVVARWNQINIFSKNLDKTIVIKQMAQNYINHFSYDFLFRKGDIDMKGQTITRHSVRGIGELYLFQLPLLIIGIIALIKEKNKGSLIIFLWLILYPIANILTDSTSPYATRSIIGVIPFQIISSFGLATLLRLHIFKKRIFKIGFYFISFVIVILSLLYFCKLLYLEYPNYSSDYWGWQYGAKNIISYFKNQGSKYDEFIMTGDFNGAYIFLKFYDPINSCHNCKIGDYTYHNPSKKQLFAVRPENLKEIPGYKFMIQDKILYSNQKEAFYIGEYVAVVN
jgi:4-amino-4-deoxy-L-arabinose transferase-like glycosyltransferase